jgi:hypothetical protein
LWYYNEVWKTETLNTVCPSSRKIIKYAMLFIVIYPSRNPSLQFFIEKQSQVLNTLHSSSWWPRIRSTQKMFLLGSYVAWVTEGAGKHEVDLNTNILVYMHFHLPWCLPLDFNVNTLSSHYLWCYFLSACNLIICQIWNDLLPIWNYILR